MMGNGPKKCSTCGTTYEFALGNFYRDKSKKGGMHTQCIECKTRGKRSSRANPLKSLDVEYAGIKPRRKSYSKSTLEPFWDNEKKKTIIIAPQQHKLFDVSKDSIPKKRCTACQKMFPITEEFFYKNNSVKDGFENTCKKCGNAKRLEWRTKNLELSVFVKKRSRALRAGLEFTLDQDRWVRLLKETNTCVDCNGSMTCTAENRNETISFDKINPTKGYLENNTRLICGKCNTQKGDLSPDEWNAVLKTRVEKGIIKKIDPKLVKYLKTRNTLEPFFMEYECVN